MNTKKQQRLADENLNKFIFPWVLFRFDADWIINVEKLSATIDTSKNLVDTLEISANPLGDLQLRALL